MLAGPALTIEGMLHEQARAISAEAGATAAQIEHERRMNTQVFALARSDAAKADVQRAIEHVIRTHLQSWPDVPAPDAAMVDDNARVMADIVAAPAYRSFLRQDPATILGRCVAPLLGIYGGKDTQVRGVANADAYREITAQHRRAAVILFPEHNHLFQPAGTGAISEYESLPPGPDEQVLRSISEWLSAL